MKDMFDQHRLSLMVVKTDGTIQYSNVYGYWSVIVQNTDCNMIAV